MTKHWSRQQLAGQLIHSTAVTKGTTPDSALDLQKEESSDDPTSLDTAWTCLVVSSLVGSSRNLLYSAWWACRD